MKKTPANARRKTMALPQAQTPSNRPPKPLSTSVQKDVSKSSSNANRCPSGPSQRKASTPTHDKPTGPVSPDISQIMPTDISTKEPSKQVTVGKPTSRPVSKPTTVKDAEKEDSSSSSSLAKVISGPASKDPRVQESMSTPSETTAKKLKRTKDELEVEDVEKEDSSSCVEKDVSEPAPKDPRVQQSTPGPIGTHAKKLKQTEDELEVEDVEKEDSSSCVEKDVSEPAPKDPRVQQSMPGPIGTHAKKLKQTEDELESSDKEISLADQLDFECTRSLQTMFRRKLAEAEACDVDDKLTALQKRMAENMNILQKTTERLKNVTFNKEVDALHKLRYPNYGRVLETLDNANCKEYLETINKKLEQSQNQLRIKNIDLPDGGTTELAQIISETLAACEKMKANNNLELPKVMAEVKASNNSTSEALSRCLDLLPEVEDVMLDRATLEICARNED